MKNEVHVVVCWVRKIMHTSVNRSTLPHCTPAQSF